MRHHLRPITLTTLSVVVAVTTLLLMNAPTSVRHAPLRDRHSVEAIEEDPAARERWEWMTLRDPATGMIPRGIERRERAFAASLAASASLSKEASSQSIAAEEWKERGPYNIGGRTRAVGIDVNNPARIVAGGVTGGMWLSIDTGMTWRRTTLPSQAPSVTCLAQDTRSGHTNVWYHGSGEFRTNSTRFGNTAYPGDGIYKSTDNGNSWNALPSTVTATPQSLDGPFDFVNAIVVDPSVTSESRVYAATYGSIMRSTDGGASWGATLGGLNNSVGYTSVAITSSGVLYAAMGSGGSVRGIYRSTDGVKWTQITPNGWADSCRRIVLSIAPSNENVVYVAAETPGQGLKINGSYGFAEYYSLWKYTYQSGDGSGSGGQWSNRSANLPRLGGAWTFNGLNSYALVLAVDPLNENTVFVGGSSLFRTTDGFATANKIDWMGGYRQNGEYGYPAALHPDQHVLLFDRTNPTTLYAGCDGGIYKTYDGGFPQPPWASLNNGFVNAQSYTVAIDPSGEARDLLVTGLQDNGTVYTNSTDVQQPWQDSWGGDGSFCAVANGGGTIFVSSQYGYVVRFTLRNDSTLDYAAVAPDSASTSLFILPFAIDPQNQNAMFFAGGGMLWRNTVIQNSSDEIAADWRRVGQAVTSDVSAIGISTSLPSHRVYYGSSDGRVFRLDDALTDNPTAIEVTSAEFPAGAYINCIAVDPHDGDKAIAVFTNYNVQSLFYTSDGGANWSAIGGNLEQHPDGTGDGPSCRWASIAHFGNRTIYFVATTTGLYSTEILEGGETIWRQEGSTSIGNVRVDMIQARESDGLVAVATWGRGVFTTTLNTLGVDEQSVATESTSLRSYPNPIHTTATISFNVPASARGGTRNVRLDIIDASGRQTATLVEERLSAGQHVATLDLNNYLDIANGVSFCRLQCDGVVTTMPLTIMR